MSVSGRQRGRRVRQRSADAAEPGATHRARPQERAPAVVRDAAEVEQPGRSQRLPRLPRGVGARRRPAVPRTDVLADVAAEHLLANRRPPFLGDRALLLDRQIRQAARGVDDVRLDDRAGRTCLEAARARAALIDAGLVGREIEVREDLRQQEPGTQPRVDEARVLADPAEPGLLGEHALLHGTVVHAGKRLETRRAGTVRVGHPLHQRAQPRAHHLVVVVAPGVARDHCGTGLGAWGSGSRLGTGLWRRCCRRRRARSPSATAGSTSDGSSRSSRDAARYVISPAYPRSIHSASRARRACEPPRAMPQRSNPSSRARSRTRSAVRSARASGARRAGCRRGGTP